MHRRKASRQREIERKFLVRTLPSNIDFSALSRNEITQTYLIVTDDNEELRIRQEGGSYFLTIKTGSGIERGQPEIALTKDQFDTLWSSEKGDRVWKTRYYVTLGKNTVHLDFYKGKLEGLVTAEVEFDNKKEARRFHPPWWFEKEVTHDEEYRNSSLALRKDPIQISDKITVPSELDRGFDKLSAKVSALVSEKEEPIVVLIAGGSASGKTSRVAARLNEKMKSNSVLISMDDYYRGAEYVKEKGINFDHPDSVDILLLREHLSMLKEGISIQKPIYDFKTGSRSQSTETVESRKVIIVEGLFALNTQLAKEGDVSVFVEVGTHGRVIRRLMRDSERTSWAPFETLRYIADVVEPMYLDHILPTKSNADIVIRNEYNPRVEALHTGMVQSQVKFKAVGGVDQELLRKSGIHRIAGVKQIDRYFMPEGVDFVKTGEMLRVRNEGEKVIFTYKGPRSDNSSSAERQIFSFEIDRDTEELVSRLYQMQPTVVVKDRMLYSHPGYGILLKVDTGVAVEKRVGGESSVLHLGGFVEMDVPPTIGGRRKVDRVAALIGLDPSAARTDSYLEIDNK